MSIDWSKPVQTIGGKPLHYVGLNQSGNFVVQEPDGNNLTVNKHNYTVPYGKIINVPQKRWVNLYLYKGNIGFACYTDEKIAKASMAAYTDEYIPLKTVEVELP